MYNFIKSIENAGNLVSVTAVRDLSGAGAVLTPVTHPPSRRNAEKMLQSVTKCYKSTSIMLSFECQKRKVDMFAFLLHKDEIILCLDEQF